MMYVWLSEWHALTKKKRNKAFFDGSKTKYVCVSKHILTICI